MTCSKLNDQLQEVWLFSMPPVNLYAAMTLAAMALSNASLLSHKQQKLHTQHSHTFVIRTAAASSLASCSPTRNILCNVYRTALSPNQ